MLAWRQSGNYTSSTMAVIDSLTNVYNNSALHIGQFRGVPSVQPRNVEAISEHYQGHTPNERIVTLGQGASSFLLRPDIDISALDREEVIHHTESGGVLLLVANHIKGVDPLTLSAVVHDEPAFEIVKHDFIIPAKPVISRVPGIRYLADGMGAFPVVRRKDVAEKDGTVSKENRAFLEASGRFTLDLMVSHLVGEDGEAGSATILAEGERNKGNPLEVQEFEMGAVYMYEKALKSGAKVEIVTAGIVYDAGSMFRPTVHIGGLFKPEGKKLKERSESIRKEVQHCVSQARHLGYRNRRAKP